MNKSSLSDSFMRVVNAICSIAGDVIKWPTPHEMPSIEENFKKKANLPSIIGVIDGTDIQIKAPKENAEYINRKKRYAINAQLVFTDKLFLIYAVIGYAGGAGDLRVLRNSDLWLAVQQNLTVFFPGEEYLIGDKIYPVRSWLIPPYKNYGNLAEAEGLFNECHAKTRQVIERANCLLKGRFRRLRFLDMNREDMIPSTMLACCVLHNICIDETVIEAFIAEHQAFLENNGEEEVEAEDAPQQQEQQVDAAGGALKRANLVKVLQNFL